MDGVWVTFHRFYIPRLCNTQICLTGRSGHKFTHQFKLKLAHQRANTVCTVIWNSSSFGVPPKVKVCLHKFHDTMILRKTVLL